MPDFSDEFKVSIVADAKSVEAKIKETSAKLEAFKVKANEQSQIKLRVTIAEMEAKIAEARRQLAQFRKDNDKAGEIKARLEIQGLQQSKNEATKILRELQNEGEKTGKSFFSLNGIVTDALKAFGGIALIRKFTDTLTDAFNAAVSFESAFAGVKKTVDASESEFQDLSDQFIELSQNIPLPVEGLVKIGELAGQLGIKKDDIIDFTKTIAAIGVTTNLTEEDAATSFARIANIFQEPVSNVANLASSVVELGNNFATTENEIVNFATRIAGAGKAVGLTTSDIAAIGAAFSSVGVEAEAGGTAVQKVLFTLNDAVLKGGKGLQNFAEITGKSAEDFVQLWKSEPAKVFDLFVQGLGKTGKKAALVLEDLVGGDERLKRAFLAISGAGDLLTRAIDSSSEAFIKNTALQEEADKRYGTTESKLQKLNARWNELKIIIGNFLKDVAVPVAEFFVSLGEAIVKGTGGLAGFVTALKTVGVAILTYLTGSALKKFADGLKAAEVATKTFSTVAEVTAVKSTVLSGALGALRTAFTLLTGPVGILVTALTIAAAAIFDSFQKAEQLKAATQELKKTLDEAAKVPSLDTLSKQFQESINKAVDLKKQLDLLSTSRNSDQFNSIASSLTSEVGTLRQETIQLLSAMGLTTAQIMEFTSQLGFFKGSVAPTTEDLNILKEKVAELSPVLAQSAADFQSEVETIVAKTGDWEKAIQEVTEKNKKHFEENGQNAEVMVDTIQELYVSNVAKSGDLGQAAAVAYGSGFDTDKTRAAITAGVGTLTDEMLNKQLAAAVLSGNNGEAAGLLLALGIGTKENIKEVANSGSKLKQSVINTFDSAKAQIFQAGKNAGSTTVGGIISGLVERIPGLADILQKITSSLGAFSGVTKAFAPLVGAVPGLQKFLSTGVDLTARVNQLKTSYQNLLSASKEPVNFGGGSGGGGGKALDEAKKKADEAEKAVDEYTKSVEANNKAAKKLRDDTVVFYKDIVTAIDKAREKQNELLKELDKFKGEQTLDFAENTAERDVELKQDEVDLQKELIDANKDLEKIKSEAVDNAEDQKSKDEDIAEKEAEIQEIQAKINAVMKERGQIQDFLNNLTSQGTEGSKEILAAFEEVRRRSTLTEFEQNKLELDDKLKQKEAEIQAEVAKQQKIIDIQTRFLALQNATSKDDLQKRKDLIALATTDDIKSAEERKEKLKELGFENLSVDQELELLKQVAKANALETEKQQIETQQQELLTKKQEFQDIFEQYHGESVDRMKQKEQELIELIQQAQIEQQRLNSLRGASDAASSSVSNTTNLNVVNNISTPVDLDAANNKLLTKIK